MGDFNASVGRHASLRPKVIGRHGIGNENENGTLLLQTRTMHSLVVTNTVFQQANKFEGSWMHPRSGHWHMIDFIISSQSDLRDVRLTRAVRSTSAWSDHRLMKCSVFLSLRPVKRRHKAVRVRKLNVAKLKDDLTRQEFVNELHATLTSASADEWCHFKPAAYNAAVKVIGFQRKRHKTALMKMTSQPGKLWMTCM